MAERWTVEQIEAAVSELDPAEVRRLRGLVRRAQCPTGRARERRRLARAALARIRATTGDGRGTA